jgi:hypothetical protein
MLLDGSLPYSKERNYCSCPDDRNERSPHQLIVFFKIRFNNIPPSRLTSSKRSPSFFFDHIPLCSFLLPMCTNTPSPPCDPVLSDHINCIWLWLRTRPSPGPCWQFVPSMSRSSKWNFLWDFRLCCYMHMSSVSCVILTLSTLTSLSLITRPEQ